MGTLHENQYTFVIISRSGFLRMRNISGKSCRNNQKHILCSIPHPPPPGYRAVYEIMWKNVLRGRQATDGNVKWRMHFTCRITKTKIHTHTHLCVTLTAVQRNNRYANASQGYVAFLVGRNAVRFVKGPIHSNLNCAV